MNKLEKKMCDLITELREDYGVIGVKAEFEAEGTRLNEMISLCEVIQRADSQLYLKIGGCEAVSDMDMSKHFGAKGVIAPMIETPFALKKFVSSAKKTYSGYDVDCELFFNMETETGYNNFDKILETEEIKSVQGVVIGRVDLTASYGLTRNEIESKKIYDICYDTLVKAKAKGLETGIGGGVNIETLDGLERFDGIIDRAETRKVIFGLKNGTSGMRKGLVKAIEFECAYMQNLKNKYGLMSQENADRIKLLEARIESLRQ